MKNDPGQHDTSAYLNVNPYEGFGPLITDDFLDLYGEDSVFVTATIDFLTWQMVTILIKSNKIGPEFEPIQYGPPEMRLTLETLIKILSASKLEKPLLVLLQSAVKNNQSLDFQIAASSLIGEDVFKEWLSLLEQKKYAEANSLVTSG
jgi:hypothetical protein